MFESTVVQVALGLVLIFFVVASIASGVNDILSRWADARAKTLWTALAKLLAKTDASGGAAGPDKGLELTVGRALKFAYPRMAHDPRPRASDTARGAPLNTDDPQPKASDTAASAPLNTPRALLNTPSLRVIEPEPDRHKPTKIDALPGKVFATGLLELAQTKKDGEELADRVKKLTEIYAGSPLGAYLSTVSTHYATDVDKFVDGVGAWFDAQMTRLTGVYRQKARYFLAAIGLVAAFFFNIDAFDIGASLRHDAALRQSITVVASDVAAGHDITTGCTVSEGAQDRTLKCGAEKLNELESLHLPVIGHWTWETWQSSWTGGLNHAVSHTAGLLATSLAVSMGAPFWFDILQFLAGRRRGSGGS